MVWFTEDDLRAAAGDGSFRRGRDYVDAVAELAPTALGVLAKVRGSAEYEVWLGRGSDGPGGVGGPGGSGASDASGGLVGECGCPFGSEGNFCKHCVAVGLALLAGGPAAPAADLGAYLRSLEHGELVDLLLAQANRDPSLYRQLVLRAGTTGAPQVAVLRRELDNALRVRGYVDADYATRAKDVLDTVRGLVDAGHAAEARPLARHAVELLADAMTSVDDPDGAVNGVCRRAVKLYARACAVARPNPTKLAAWLFQLRLSWTTWPTLDLADFAEPLGETGMAEYRALLASSTADETVLRPMREQLAKATGDVDALVDALASGTPTPRAYREIVSVLRQAGRLDEAIQWAERGVAARNDLELTELLVTCYVAGQRGDEAVELRKTALRSAPTRLCYARLRETAVEVKMWAALRSWALDVLESSPGELVGALLDDGEVSAAWLAAVKYDCVSVEVVRAWGAVRPGEVVSAYQELVSGCFSRGSRDAYREGVVLLREFAALADVTAFVASVKLQFGRRPALLDELRRAGF